MTGAEDVDLEMHGRLVTRHAEDQKRDLLMIQSGGLWTAHAMCKAGYLTSGLCHWCGEETEDLAHLWWRCKAHAHHRQEVLRKLGGRWEQLPPCVALHGIPVEPTADLEVPPWTRGVERGLSEHSRYHLVGDDRIAWTQIELELQTQTEYPNLPREPGKLTTRQLAQWMHGDFGEFPAWEIAELRGEPPAEPNLYTDGGVDFGQLPWLAFGAWGLHLPEQSSEALPLQLRDDAHVTETEHGVIAGGQTNGPALSSARQEAIGWYAGLAIQKAQNVAIDNSAVVQRATELLRARGRCKNHGAYSQMEMSGGPLLAWWPAIGPQPTRSPKLKGMPRMTM